MLTADEIGSVKGGNESIKKYGKLSKIRKLSKAQKLAKSRKKLSKSRYLPHFNTKKNEFSFLTPNTKTAFNYLRLAFIKTPIF